METKKPEVFYHSEFCKAVCGYTDSELRDILNKNIIKPHMNSIGLDMPRTSADKVVDSWITFMSIDFRLPLLNMPMKKIYEAFRKFKLYEEYIHPRKHFVSHKKVYDTIYEKIELAYMERDVNSFKEGTQELVDIILHD